MPSVHALSVYNPYMTVPREEKFGPVQRSLCHSLTASVKKVCNTPLTSLFCLKNTLPEDIKIKVDLTNKLAEFCAHGHKNLLLGSNGESVTEKFRSFINTHIGLFTAQDKEIIKAFSEKLKSVISPAASSEKKEQLTRMASEISAMADAIFCDIPLVIAAEGVASSVIK